MTVAALGALCIGEMGEAATVVLLFTFGEGLERFSATRARESLKSLMSLQPEMATVIRAHAAGAHGDAHDEVTAPRTSIRSVVPASHVFVGDLMLVRPGERIAADGVIAQGESSVNQAAVTGESIPVARGPGDAVLAGTVNGEAALRVTVTRLARRLHRGAHRAPGRAGAGAALARGSLHRPLRALVHPGGGGARAAGRGGADAVRRRAAARRRGRLARLAVPRRSRCSSLPARARWSSASP